MVDVAPRDQLFVLLAGRVAGTLNRGETAGSYTFSYDEDWRHDPEAFPLSLSLPLASRTHGGPRVSYYLRALLPSLQTLYNAYQRAS